MNFIKENEEFLINAYLKERVNNFGSMFEVFLKEKKFARL